MRTRSSGRSAKIPMPEQGLSTKPSQASLIAARCALLTNETSDPRSPWVYDRVNRSNGLLRYSKQTEVLDRPYPKRASLRTLPREDQRTRVSDPERRLNPSKPWKLWRSHVKLIAEQRLADEEAEELVSELNDAMKDGDLEQINLLTKQIDELSNGICKKMVEKSVKEQAHILGQHRASTSVLNFARRLRIDEEDEN